MKNSTLWEQLKGIRLARTLSVLVLALSLLVGCSGTPPVDALAAVSQACATTQEQDYDVYFTAASPGQNQTMDIRVSANDAYQLTAHLTIDESNGMEPDSLTVELIEVDGIVYSREDGPEWGISDDIPPGLFFSLTSLCNDVTRGEVQMVGSDDINANPTTRYIHKESTPGSSDGATTISSIDTTTEYWVDSSGQLAKISRAQVIGGESGEGVRVEGVLLISGVGETNVITAPKVP